MGGSAITYLGYSCIVASTALLWFGLPNRTGESPRWLRSGHALPLFPVFLMALFVGGVILIAGFGGLKPW
jgi:hypothetical protein